jgi:iron complex outermembrane receptor protein
MRFNQFILGVLFMIIGPAVMNAQTIKGIVTDENGQALPYSNVIDKE